MGESRLPRNLQGLLRFCMQVGDNPETTATVMDPERARWLSEAMDSLTVNIGKKLKENITKILQNTDSAASGNADSAAACLECLEDTADLCENLDVANDFVKLGGLDVAAYVCQRCGDEGCADGGELRASALHLMARIFQNNPFAQAAGLGCVADLVTTVRSSDSAVRFAALSALSCLVRDNPQALAACADANGLGAVTSCLRLSGCGGAENYRLRHKAAFLLASLAAESDELADRLAGVEGLLDALAESIAEAAASGDADAVTDDAAKKFDWLEHALRCLLLLCQQRGTNFLLGDAVWRLRLTVALDSIRQFKRLPEENAELVGQLLMMLSQLEDIEHSSVTIDR